jgi:hypothetical protein
MPAGVLREVLGAIHAAVEVRAKGSSGLAYRGAGPLTGRMAVDGVVPGSGSDRVPGWGHLAAAVEQAQSRADELLREALRIAEQIAVAEDAAAGMFARMAELRAKDADRLRARSQAARDHAAWEREWIRNHSDRGGADRVQRGS